MLQGSLNVPSTPPTDAFGGDGDGRNAGSNVDRQLYKNLVEMVPLVESLMHRRVCSAYSRRAPMVYTPAPSKSKKPIKSTPSASAKKQRDLAEKSDEATLEENENMQKYMDEIAKLREQIEDLQKKLIEKEESLRIAENSVNEMNSVHASLNEFKYCVAEKEALIQSSNSQLINAKVLLAEKQAALEKLEWELETSNTKIKELQDSFNSMEFEISAMLNLIEKLCENESIQNRDFDISPFDFEPLQTKNEIYNDKNNERLEEEINAYLSALNAAKENPTEELLYAAMEARLKVRAFIF